MSEKAREFWELLNKAEDYVHFGRKTERGEPGSVRFREEHSSPSMERDGQSPVKDGPSPATDRRPPSSVTARRPAPVAADDDDIDSELATRKRRLAMLEERVHACTRCQLHSGRINAVPGTGVLDPLVMVIGEGPGADEDHRGLPFVGRAGQFLDKWLEAVGLSRTTNAYISNIVKCRPPENRDPLPHESEACLPYLREQISLIRPMTIMTVGRIASGILIGSDAGIGKLRGRTYYYDGIPLVPTYHPSGVLRNPEYKRPVWEDLKRLRALIPEDE
jgi:uracil-DNA glycosylase